MKVYKRITISIFLLVLCMIFEKTVEAQESNQLSLSILEKEVAIVGQKRSIALHVKIVNQSDRRYKFFCFHNQWEPLRNADNIPDFVHSGFNVIVFNDNAKIFSPPLSIDHSQNDHMKIFMTKGADSALVAAKKLAAKLERLMLEYEQRIRDSAKWISPRDSLETILEINLYNHGLTKGKYNLEIYYVMNNKIFKYTEKSDDLFMGYLKSNRIQIIVE